MPATQLSRPGLQPCSPRSGGIDLDQAVSLRNRLAQLGGEAEAFQKTAVITQPHRAWQDVNAGSPSLFPGQLDTILLAQDFTEVTAYIDSAVNIDLFAKIVSTAREENLALWYHQGHGSVNKIYATSKYPGPLHHR